MTLFDTTTWEGGADLSPDGVYRYRLWRGGAPRLGFVMLNPSVADAATDDLTITKCKGFARREGFHGIDVVNLFAFRATNPDQLVINKGDVYGPGNPAALAALFQRCETVVAAWGTRYASTIANRKRDCLIKVARHDASNDRSVVPLAAATGVRLVCLGVTKDGHPRHPSRLGYDTPLIPWPVTP